MDTLILVNPLRSRADPRSRRPRRSRAPGQAAGKRRKKNPAVGGVFRLAGKTVLNRGYYEAFRRLAKASMPSPDMNSQAAAGIGTTAIQALCPPVPVD